MPQLPEAPIVGLPDSLAHRAPQRVTPSRHTEEGTAFKQRCKSTAVSSFRLLSKGVLRDAWLTPRSSTRIAKTILITASVGNAGNAGNVGMLVK